MDVNIYTTPNAFYAEDSFCINADSVLFSDSSQAGSDNPINSWAWFFADTILYGPKVYYHPIDTLEEQLVTLKVNTVHQCSDSYDDSVYFFLDTLLNPGFKVTYNGHMVTVTDTTKNSIRNDWDFGDGTTLADTSGPVTHIYANGGKKYLITMTAYSRCDVDTVQQWTELIATGIEPQAAAFDFQILPNPNNGIFSLVAGKGYSHYVWIEITDLSGRPVWENEWNPVESGYKIPVDLRQSAKGLYVVNIHTKEGNITRVLAYQ